MAKKIYAVKVGLNPGIYETWEECKKQVDGFSGAAYKSFKTLQDAQNYLRGIVDNPICTVSVNTPSEAVAYVDGSYDNTKKIFSYGLVIFINGNEYKFCDKFDDVNLVSMRNVAGEITGARKAMEYCVENGIKSLDLYYDYEGIEKWCTGDWKTNKEGTKDYKKYYDSIKTAIKVTFYKVTAHSGDKYNDMADELAKSAIKSF